MKLRHMSTTAMTLALAMLTGPVWADMDAAKTKVAEMV